jgi:hypothetical protein
MLDRHTKVLLGLIATGLWAIALRPLLPVHDVSAQAPAQTSSPAAAPTRVVYEVIDVDQGNTAGIYQIKKQIDGLAGDGWRAKSLSITSEATVVLMEKTVPAKP